MSKYLQTNYVDKPIAMTEQRRNENSAEQQTSNFHPIFLSSIIILISFCLFVSAVSLPEWRLEISVGDKNNKMLSWGLFAVCQISAEPNAQSSCFSSQQFAAIGGVLQQQESDLEQATKGMIIVTIIFCFATLIASILFSLRRYHHYKRALFVVAMQLFTAICGTSSMICYSLLISNLQELLPLGTFLFAGYSFYFGWFASSFLYLASFISLLTIYFL